MKNINKLENQKGITVINLVLSIVIIITLGVVGFLAYQYVTLSEQNQIVELDESNNVTNLNNVNSNSTNSNSTNSNNTNSNNTNSNTTKETETKTIEGEFSYVVPEKLIEEIGQYYEDIEIKFTNEGDFSLDLAEGFHVKGKYTINDNKLICEVEYLNGEFIDEIEIDNVFYNFEILDENLIKLEEDREGVLNFINTDGEESKYNKSPFETAGSIFVKEQ